MVEVQLRSRSPLRWIVTLLPSGWVTVFGVVSTGAPRTSRVVFFCGAFDAGFCAATVWDVRSLGSAWLAGAAVALIPKAVTAVTTSVAKRRFDDVCIKFVPPRTDYPQ
ncbi:hypothetical protein GCM10027599_06900 [Yimella radicis]